MPKKPSYARFVADSTPCESAIGSSVWIVIKGAVPAARNLARTIFGPSLRISDALKQTVANSVSSAL
jgi:hypothetical protein